MPCGLYSRCLMPWREQAVQHPSWRQRQQLATIARNNRREMRQKTIGEDHMAAAVNAGGRLDRLPISGFHYRIFWLIGAGMFFDGYDLYVGTAVLPALLQAKFSTLAQNAQFVSFTFFGMTIGALVTGFLGDRFGRRFKYQL